MEDRIEFAAAFPRRGDEGDRKYRAPFLSQKKFEYIQKDVERLGQYFGIPLRPISDPQTALAKEGSLTCQRFLTSLKARKPDLLETVSRELWLRRWSKDLPIKSEKDDFWPIFEKIRFTGADAEEILAKIQDEETKKALAACTQEAVDNGAFGAPWIHVYKDGKIHTFWGSDRFHVIAWLIGEEWKGPLKEKSAKFQ